jgi:hypothetical protein
MSIEFLQSWYQRQCNGFWEHGFGVTIETLDQPGWMVTVDLAETPWATEAMIPLRRERSDKDWIACEVVNEQFRGQGDSQKLGEILRFFEAWAGKKT